MTTWKPGVKPIARCDDCNHLTGTTTGNPCPCGATLCSACWHNHRQQGHMGAAR